jgi:hypothetical protein
MKHELAWERLPDLLGERDDPNLLAHVADCLACQRQLFLLGRVDRLLRQARPQSRRSGRARLVSLRSLSRAAMLAAAALVLVLLWPRPPGTHALALRTAQGRTIGHATIARVGQSNAEVSLVARGMTRSGADQFLLWAQPGGNADATPVGEFMADSTGYCRARFKLPSRPRWVRFWITTASDPSQVLATT